MNQEICNIFGDKCADITLHATFVLGEIEPHPDQKEGPLDVGPKVTVKVYMVVGNVAGVVARHDLTFYLQAFEYTISNYAICLNDIFRFKPCDVIKFYAYYEITAPSPEPFDPNNFYVNLKNTFLSICAYSAVKEIEYNDSNFFLDNTKTHAEIPIGSNVNTVIHTFKPNVDGLSFIQARLNIMKAQAYINDGGTTTSILNVNWILHMRVNGVTLPQYISVEASGNQPFVFNSQTNVFPSTLFSHLLADLEPDDRVELICNCTGVYITMPPPIFFGPLEDGKIIADFSINTLANRNKLYPHGLLEPLINNYVYIPIDTNITSAVPFPLHCSRFNFDNNFEYRCGKLIYCGCKPSWFRINCAINLVDMQLFTSDSDTVTVFVSTYGFLIGINGKARNNIITETNIYRDTRYTVKLLANQVTENYVKLVPGDTISLLIYTFNTVYISDAPAPSVTIKTPAAGSTIKILGNVNMTIE